MVVRFVTALGIALLLPGALPARAAVAGLEELARPGRVLMLRHATAPGYGDPPGFRIGDCATQRNLDAAGRREAVALGERLRQAGIRSARVYSSQWCRCLETARLLGVGEPREEPALNSFFNAPERREPTLTALRRFLAALPADGPPVILVTHQVTINAFTDAATPAAGGSIFQLDGSGAPRWIGRIAE